MTLNQTRDMSEFWIQNQRKYHLFERLVRKSKHFGFRARIWVFPHLYLIPISHKSIRLIKCMNVYLVDCGVQPMLGSGSAMTLSKMANVGDWPWHVSLHRDDTHVCDGTLVSENWVLTTESCFQGQSKATWIAVLGNIRLNSRTPWTQRRRIVSFRYTKTNSKLNLILK